MAGSCSKFFMCTRHARRPNPSPQTPTLKARQSQALGRPPAPELPNHLVSSTFVYCSVTTLTCVDATAQWSAAGKKRGGQLQSAATRVGEGEATAAEKARVASCRGVPRRGDTPGTHCYPSPAGRSVVRRQCHAMLHCYSSRVLPPSAAVGAPEVSLDPRLANRR